MGQGSKFSSALSTIGGRSNVITAKDIASGDSLAKSIIEEMKQENIKFTKNEIIFVAKLSNGNKIFLEKNAANHIVKRHALDFEKAFGIKSDEIPNLLHEVISKGKLVSSNVKSVDGKTYFSNKYYYKGNYSIVCGIAENGYIETAYPRGNK